MTLLFLGAFLATLIVGIAGIVAQRRAYERLVDIVVADRDRDRLENKVFRALLFPAIVRAEKAVEAAGIAGDSSLPQNKPPAPQHTPTPAASTTQPPASPLDRKPGRMRLPFRIRFNQTRRELNTKQQKTDALASALEKQKPQEKTNQ